jgi:hypothetical protein
MIAGGDAVAPMTGGVHSIGVDDANVRDVVTQRRLYV